MQVDGSEQGPKWKATGKNVGGCVSEKECRRVATGEKAGGRQPLRTQVDGDKQKWMRTAAIKNARGQQQSKMQTGGSRHEFRQESSTGMNTEMQASGRNAKWQVASRNAERYDAGKNAGRWQARTLQASREVFFENQVRYVLF
jgi:hypothetical protein